MKKNAIISKNREYLFDNLKALLIILVVFGHAMQYFEIKDVFLKVRGVIYVFHMPLFIFISGYFSKDLNQKEDKLIKNILIPFFIFNTIYYNIITEEIVDKNIFLPVYAYWYLMSLFFWRVLTKYIVKFKYSMILSVFMSLYIGMVRTANKFFSISRTIVFFPIFMLGYYTTKEDIEKIRKMSKKITIPMLLILIAITFILSNNIINVDFFKNDQSYHYSGVSNLKGICIRLFQFLIATGISICLINLVSSKNNRMSNIGQKTITIYVLSPFVQEFLGRIVKITMGNIIGTNIITLIICCIMTFIIVALCSLDKVYEIYNRFIDWIYRKLTIEDVKLN